MARILFVTSRLPYPPMEGHQLRAWHLLCAAARHHEVHLLSLQRTEDPRQSDAALTDQLAGIDLVELPALDRTGPLLMLSMLWAFSRRPLLDLRYRTRALQRRFDQLVGKSDLVHLDILALAGLIDRTPHSIPVVLNEHNVESLLARKRIDIETQHLRRMMLRASSEGLKQFERQACRRADQVLACSPEDAGRLRALAPGCQISIIPNGVDLEFFSPGSPDQEQANSLVFVGHMNWFPNRDGIEHFIADILPLLADRPGLELKVIGRNTEFSIPKALAGQVEVTGFVEDLRPLVQRAAVFVVPLRVGSGTRLKVLEAMAMGKAIVSTRVGVEGIGLVDGQSVLLADTPSEFAGAVKQLLDCPTLRHSLGRRARELAERCYGWTAIGQRLLTTYDGLLQAHPEARRSTPTRAEGLGARSDFGQTPGRNLPPAPISGPDDPVSLSND